MPSGPVAFPISNDLITFSISSSVVVILPNLLSVMNKMGGNLRLKGICGSVCWVAKYSLKYVAFSTDVVIGLFLTNSNRAGIPIVFLLP